MRVVPLLWIILIKTWETTLQKKQSGNDLMHQATWFLWLWRFTKIMGDHLSFRCFWFMIMRSMARVWSNDGWCLSKTVRSYGIFSISFTMWSPPFGWYSHVQNLVIMAFLFKWINHMLMHLFIWFVIQSWPCMLRSGHV